jgi:hypothetical protein
MSLPAILQTRVLASLLVAACLGACSLTYDATALGVPATLASSASEPVEGEHFEVTSRAVWGLWGLVQLSQPDLRKALAHQVGDGAAVADIRIKSKARFSDILFTVITIGLLSTRSVTVEGTVVQ